MKINLQRHSDVYQRWFFFFLKLLSRFQKSYFDLGGGWGLKQKTRFCRAGHGSFEGG